MECHLPSWDWVDLVVFVIMCCFWEKLSLYKIILGLRLITSAIYKWRVYISRKLCIRDVSMCV